MQSRLAKHLRLIVLVAVACLAISWVPVQAQGISVNLTFSNWAQVHSLWTDHCYSAPQHGHWGRDARYDKWCSDNHRFSAPHPDSQWQHDHSWDHGNQSDREPGAQR